MSETSALPRPAVDYLKVPEDGQPYLAGSRCTSCGAIFLGSRSICSKCATKLRG
jgi:uncharacterized OB-fold protein